MRRCTTSFHGSAIENLVGVGATDKSSVRIWVRSSELGPHELVLTPEKGPTGRYGFEVSSDDAHDGIASVGYPRDFPGGAPLTPLERYRFSVERRRDRFVLGSGAFETSPASASEAPDRFALAFASCHQPFLSSGAVDPKAIVLLDALEPLLEAEAVKRLVLSGDQMYADSPSPLSLFDADYFATVAPSGKKCVFDCSREQVRRLYQQRYRIFWQMPAFVRLQAERPVYMSFDDHEVVDNFGSRVDHAAEHFRALRQGALDAAWDYQGLRMAGPSGSRPASMHFAFEYGPVAVFVLDVRSERRRTPEALIIYGERQHQELREFLATNAAKPVVVIVTGVPVVHVPDWLTAAVALVERGHTDISDRWSAPRARTCRRRLLGLIYEHQTRNPDQRIVLVGGDVHTGSVHELAWDGTGLGMVQLNASAITNRRTTPLQRLMQSAPELMHHIDIGPPYPRLRVRRMPGAGGAVHNPVGTLNLGLLAFSHERGRTRFRVELVAYDAKRRAARPVFVSPEL
jgi:alkaline phosphatase D